MLDITKPDELLNYKHWQVLIGTEIDLSDTAHLIENYEKRLAVCIIRAWDNNPDYGIKKAISALEWLRNSDFYTSPASTQYHEAYEGGLLIHSCKVFNCMLELRSGKAFKTTDLYSAALCALTHDWCKIGTYESYMKNVKDEATGKWTQQKAYKKNYKNVPLGHGVTSMYLVSRIVSLKPDEACAIRWHQGRWNVCDPEQNEFQQANEMYPLVHLIQFADQLAITDYAIVNIEAKE